MSENLDKIKAIKKKIKHGKLKLVRKDVKSQVLKGVKDTSKEREDICKKARESAHTVVADTKRDMSNEIRKHSQTLSEGFDFIEESYGTGIPSYTFYDEPQQTESITEAFGENSKYGMIGVAEGVFAPIGVMSRNNRIYDEDHYDYLLENQMLVNKINSRGMLGTIGHHDKRVDDDDLAEEKVSHIVTDLHIQEEVDGTRNLVGRLEILNTKAGRALKTYYDSGMPLYVSSRGAGKLLNVANESYKRVDKTNYYLETFDIVKDPGFLQAKPNYVKEAKEETKQDIDNNTIGENNMENKKVVPAIDTKMEAEEIINKLLHPLQEQLAELTETVKLLSDKVLEEDVVDEEKAEETTEVVEEAKEEVSEEVKSEEVSESVESTAEVVEEACADKKEDEEEKEEEKVEEACADKEEKEDKEEKKEEAVEEAKEEVSEEAEIKKETETNEDEIKAPVAEGCEDKEEDCNDEDEDEEAEEVEESKSEETVEEACEIKKETETNEDEIKAPVAEEKSEDSEVVEEGCGCKDHEEEKHHEEEEEEEHKECDEAVEEAKVDYEAKFKESEAVMNDLVKMVSEASARSKALVEKYEATLKELNAYKLSEELSITIDEAKEKLETKSYDEIKEEAKAEPVVEEAKEEEVSEEVKSEEAVVESKKAIKPVFSRFSSVNEDKKTSKKVFSIFG